MAELNTELVSDVLGVADESLERLADALLGDAGLDDLVIDVAGETGSMVAVALAVENSRPDPAVISCETRAVNGFALDVTPRQFPLDPAETRQVSIEVGLPAGAAGPPTDAGSVTIRGQDERDLVVRIVARVDEKIEPRGAGSDPDRRVVSAGDPCGGLERNRRIGRFGRSRAGGSRSGRPRPFIHVRLTALRPPRTAVSHLP